MKEALSKLICIAAAAVIAAAAMTACGDEDDEHGVFDIFSQSRSEDNDSAEEDSSVPQEETVTVTTTTAETKKTTTTTVTTTKKTTTTTVTTAPPVKHLDAPVNYTAKTADDGLLITWDAVSGANSYEVKLGDLDKITNNCSVTLTGTEDTSTLAILVRALNISGDDIIAESEWRSVSFDLSKIHSEDPPKRKGNEMTDNGDSITRKIEWLSLDGKTRFWTKVTIKKTDYQRYRKEARWFMPSEYINYINESYNRSTCKNIADAILKAAESQGYTKSETVYEAIRFVQSIPYKTDLESRGQREFPKYPVETIYDDNGDCEDLSMLLLSIIREMGFQTCFIEFSDHIAVGILGADGLEGSYYEVNGRKYYYVETTDFGWQFGQIPESRKGEKAVIIEIPM